MFRSIPRLLGLVALLVAAIACDAEGGNPSPGGPPAADIADVVAFDEVSEPRDAGDGFVEIGYYPDEFTLEIVPIAETSPEEVATPEIASPIPEVVADVCAPVCGGRSCGDDGCGGSCGACGEGTGCVEGQCAPLAPCADAPYLSETFGRVSALRIPAGSDATGSRQCPDLDGDGAGDSGIAMLGQYVNAGLAGWADDPNPAILFSIGHVFDEGFGGSFPLSIVSASDSGSGWLVDAASLDAGCAPDTLLDAFLWEESGQVDTEPRDYVGPMLFGPLPLTALGGSPSDALFEVPMHAFTVRATLSPTEARTTDGYYGGYYLVTDLEAAIADFQAECEGPTPPADTLCSLAPALGIVSSMADLDLDGNGTNEALSVCYAFSLVPATVVGVE